MPARSILQLGNPILTSATTAFEDPTSTEAQDLVRDLAETLASFRAASGFGRGIAAPQIGALRKVLFIRMQPDGFAGPLFQPRIVWESPERFELWDDCFSFPDLLVRVSRAQKIRVEYRDQQGQDQRLEAEGDLSELLQHEIDHLDGILAVHRAIAPDAFATRTEWEKTLRG